MPKSAYTYPLLEALLNRRSRRFGLGMRMTDGAMRYTSKREPVPLSEEEEALLAFAACGFTGPALGDLDYTLGGGGGILAGMLGRTISSGDAIQAVSVFVINSDGTFLLKRPRDFAPAELAELAALARERNLVELYRRSRVRLKDGRSQPPLDRFFNLNINRWSLYDPAATYFLPVNEMTLMHINGMLEIFGEQNGAFLVDERAMYRPAGVKKFARSRGGHLDDNPMAEKTFTIQQVESLVSEFVAIEQGMTLQNLALMTQALGLGGFPHWAAHPYGWLEALGFRTTRMGAARYLGIGPVLRTLARLAGREPEVPLAQGLEHEGKPLLTPFCPPYYPSMEAAVRAVVELKYGPDGVYRGGATASAWRDPGAVAGAAQPPSESAIEATIAYCTYVYERYGRFPGCQPPFRTVLGFQANHVDVDFYDKFYRPDALSETQRRHMREWHGESQ